MITKAESTPGVADTAKLVLAAAVLVGGIAAYYYFENESILLRVAGLLVALAIGSVVAFQSLQGQLLWRFIQNSRNDIRKVIWPTRQETVQTTLIVGAFVVVVALFLWGLDSLLGWLVSLVIG